MLCKHCGNENDGSCRFCTGCGRELVDVGLAQQTATKRKNKNVAAWVMSAVSLVLAVALVLSLVGAFDSASANAAFVSKSFAEPEDAIEYYVECLKNKDFEGALKACAISEMATGYDFEAMAKRFKSIQPIHGYTKLLPSDYDEYVQYNQSNLASQMMFKMVHSVASISVFSGLGDKEKDYIDSMAIHYLLGGMPICEAENDDFNDIIDDVIGDLEPVDLRGLKIVNIEEHEMRNREVCEKNDKKQAKTYGADNVAHRVVLYEFDDEYYISAFALYEFDGRWLIGGFCEPLTNMSAMSTFMKLDSKSQFNELLDYSSEADKPAQDDIPAQDAKEDE